MWVFLARALARWFVRSWRRNFERATATTAALALARHFVNGKPETVFRGSLQPGAGIQIRVREPGER